MHTASRRPPVPGWFSSHRFPRYRTPQKANPVARPEPDDFEPDGTWYSLFSLGSTLYAVEPNHGELDRILLNGQVQRVVDISASQGHIVPTAMTFGPEGALYVSNFGFGLPPVGLGQIVR